MALRMTLMNFVIEFGTKVSFLILNIDFDMVFVTMMILLKSEILNFDFDMVLVRSMLS